MLNFINGNINLLSKNISNKKVLVLGSGPSAREIDWKSKEWDVLVTTSFFYLNDEVIKQKPIHITLSDLVDLSNKTLISYLDKNIHTTIGFEPKAHPFYKTDDFEKFNHKYKSRIINYNVNGKKEGVAARLCWLILKYKPTELILCGIDGISKCKNSDPPNYFRNHVGTTDNYTYECYYDSFIDFGTKLYSTAKNMEIKIKNLGKGKPYNMLTDISEIFEND